MKIQEYIDGITKTYMSYYTTLVNAASYFGEVIEDSFEHYEEFDFGELQGEYYIIDVNTSNGRRRIAIGTYWNNHYLGRIKTLQVYEDYKKNGFNIAHYIIDRKGNLYKCEDGFGCEYKKVER